MTEALFAENDGRYPERFQFYLGPFSFHTRFEGADLDARFRVRWNALLGQFRLQLFGVVQIREHSELDFERLRP